MPSIAELNALAEDMQRQRDEEYFRNHPWEKPTTIVADMFGDVRDNPMVRAARELQFDRAVADERAKTWIANKKEGESTDDILKSVYGPLAAGQAAARGIMPGQPVAQNRLSTYKMDGGGVIGVDPVTREVVRLVEDAPPKPVAEKSLTWKTAPDEGIFGKGSSVSLTPTAFAGQWSQLPEFARTNMDNMIQLRGHGFDFGTNGVPRRLGANPFAEGFRLTTSGAKPQVGKPTRAKAAEYVKKFGRSSAMEKLKADGFDISGYAD